MQQHATSQYQRRQSSNCQIHIKFITQERRVLVEVQTFSGISFGVNEAGDEVFLVDA